MLQNSWMLISSKCSLRSWICTLMQKEDASFALNALAKFLPLSPALTALGARHQRLQWACAKHTRTGCNAAWRSWFISRQVAAVDWTWSMKRYGTVILVRMMEGKIKGWQVHSNTLPVSWKCFWGEITVREQKQKREKAMPVENQRYSIA